MKNIIVVYGLVENMHVRKTLSLHHSSSTATSRRHKESKTPQSHSWRRLNGNEKQVAAATVTSKYDDVINSFTRNKNWTF